MSKLVLFDLDGTLLSTQGAGMRAMARAGAGLFGDGFHFEGIVAAGGLDPLLFAAAAERCGVDINDDNHTQFADAYFTTLEEELTIAARNGGVRVMPGVVELLALLHAHEGVTLGLLTGNYGRTAELKLRAGGIEPAQFVVRSFGDEAPDRPAMVPVALGRYESLHGRAVDPRDVVLIGDTPKDVEAAQAHGCIALAVATGPFDVEQLLAAGADAAVADLADATVLWEMLSLAAA
ncbi:HAD hydrolase-like protein [Planctomycetales bacterium ZRK34]|nr:HAD hydrolase-like protein [Planctomycetales bacterium ZRK34]